MSESEVRLLDTHQEAAQGIGGVVCVQAMPPDGMAYVVIMGEFSLDRVG